MNKLSRTSLLYLYLTLLFSGTSHAGFFDDLKTLVVDRDEVSLCQAIRKNQGSRIRNLIKGNPNLVNTTKEPVGCDLPLHEIAVGGQVDAYKIVRSLIKDVNKKNAKGDTPLHYAVSRDFKRLKTMYISEGMEMIRLLIEDGADVNKKNGSGVTPLKLAISKGNKDVAKLLISKGANDE